VHEHDDQVAAAGSPSVRVPRPGAALHGDPARAALAGRHEALSPASLLHLQRAIGNAGVASLLEEDAGDHAGEGHEAHGQGAAEARSPVLDVVGSGGGSSLDPDTRSVMESGLGHDFGDVRVHTDGAASESAKAVNAHAYTVGTDVVFQSGAFSPGTDSGRRMLAHELTHVVQQKAGPVDGSPAAGGIRLSDPSDRFEREADAMADRVMSAQTSPVQTSTGGPQPPSVQRQGDEEEEVQALHVQRQEGGEEEMEEVQASAVQRQGEEPEEEMEE
jgi:hypothetical protein